jgi:hypothetical protein
VIDINSPGTQLEPEPAGYIEGRAVSALGLRLRKIREQIDAAAQRGETKLLNEEEFDRLMEEMRPSDPNLP